ncbi:hypothetical protein [Methanosarcina vacuolata]|uniref:hypothetical protein n=1 Tax=Methanosarcina vacuolata TaxID=2215 RepID=UPI00064E9487|nr:hypothetical protein [Methanosarcina vacuolata]
MKKREKAYSIALASTAMILFLMLALSMASASPKQNASFTITETLVVANQSVGDFPVIYGDIIAWTDERNDYDYVYIYDLSEVLPFFFKSLIFTK